jgi:hypothetical protein
MFHVYLCLFTQIRLAWVYFCEEKGTYKSEKIPADDETTQLGTPNVSHPSHLRMKHPSPRQKTVSSGSQPAHLPVNDGGNILSKWG